MEDVKVQFDVDGNLRTMWVGQPFEVSESSGVNENSAPNFWTGRLECTPYFTDWSAYRTVHTRGTSVVPAKAYDVSVVATGCDGDPGAYSAPLTINTSEWGDAVACWEYGDGGFECGSSPNGDSSFDDIGFAVEKFRNLPGAMSKTSVDIMPDVLDFDDISGVVDVFRGLPYPFTPPVNPCS